MYEGTLCGGFLGLFLPVSWLGRGLFWLGKVLFSGPERPPLLNNPGITVIPASNTTGSTVHTPYTPESMYREVHLPGYTGGHIDRYTTRVHREAYRQGIPTRVHREASIPTRVYRAVYTHQGVPGCIYPPGCTGLYHQGVPGYTHQGVPGCTYQGVLQGVPQGVYLSLLQRVPKREGNFCEESFPLS